MYLDVHTHKHCKNTPSVYAIYNQSLDEPIRSHQPISLGIHPWHISNTPQQQLNTLEQQLQNARPNVAAIGECGLDQQIPTSLHIQQQIFAAQIHLANTLQYPLVIHCVRAWSELITTLTKHQAKVPIIIHGFNQRPSIATQLLAKGYTLSFGAALLHPTSNAHTLLATLPANAFLLETDDHPSSIQQIYQQAAHIRQTDIHTLQQQLLANAQQLGITPSTHIIP